MLDGGPLFSPPLVLLSRSHVLVHFLKIKQPIAAGTARSSPQREVRAVVRDRIIATAAGVLYMLLSPCGTSPGQCPCLPNPEMGGVVAARSWAPAADAEMHAGSCYSARGLGRWIRWDA